MSDNKQSDSFEDLSEIINANTLIAERSFKEEEMPYPTVGSGCRLSCLLFLSLLLGIAISQREELEPDFQDVLNRDLNQLPYLRLELREGVGSDFDNVYVRFFLNQTVCPIMVSTYVLENVNDRPKRRESFAIVMDMEDLNETAHFFAQPAGSFFYIVLGAVDLSVVDEVFRELWYTRGIFRTMLLTVDNIMFYDPFWPDAARRKFGGILPLNNKALNRVFDDLNGYPLRVQIFKSVYARPVFDRNTGRIKSVEGADAQVAKNLEKNMNFTLVLQEPSEHFFGERSANGSYNGAIGMMIRGKTDITLTGFFVKDYLVPEIEFSVAVYDDQLCCYVHKAPRIPQSILPVFAVRFDFWVTFILSAFACGTIWTFIRRVNLWIGVDEIGKPHLAKHLRSQFIRIYIDTWVVWVRVNVVSYPPFTSERIFILSICLVSVIFGAIIESSLATVYIHPMYYKDINNLHELEESKLDIIYKYTSFKDDLFFSETSPLFAALNKRLKHVKNLTADVMFQVAESGGVASVSRYSSLMLESIHYILARKVHIVKECPKYYTIAYVMPKDSPFAERINRLLLRFANAGLIKKWIKDMNDQANMIVMKSQEFEEGQIFKVLTLVDLQLAFYVVVFGSTLSAMSFLAELCMRHRRSSGAPAVIEPYRE